MNAAPISSLGSLWVRGNMESVNPDGQPAQSWVTLGFDPAKHRFVHTPHEWGMVMARLSVLGGLD